MTQGGLRALGCGCQAFDVPRLSLASRRSEISRFSFAQRISRVEPGKQLRCS